MKTILGLLTLTVINSAATLYLANPTTGSVPKVVTGITTANPGVLTSVGHGFIVNDYVWCDGFLPNSETKFNSVSQINSVPTADTFTLKSLAGTPHDGAGMSMPTGAFATNPRYDLPICAKVAAYTTTSHPKGFLDGSGGPYTTSVKDPGTGVAPKATLTWKPWEAIDYLGTFNAFRRVASGTATGYHWQWPALAFHWYGDNTETASKDAALDWFSNPSRVLDAGHFGISPWMEGGGRGERAEYASWYSYPMLLAYSMLYGEMDSTQRQNAQDAIFKGWRGESCTNQQEFGAGTVTYNTGSKTITGTGTSFTSYVVGQTVSLPTGKKAAFYTTIASIASDTSMTLTAFPTANGTNQPFGVIHDWTTADCGVFWLAAHHGVAPKRAFAVDIVQVTMTANINDSQTTISVDDATPFAALPANSILTLGGLLTGAGAYVYPEEVVILQSVDEMADTITVTRGAYNTTKGSGGLNKKITYSTKGVNQAIDGTWNLYNSDVTGIAIAGLIMADEDTRAADAAQFGWNSWYLRHLPVALDDWTAMSHAGFGNGYQARHPAFNLMLLNVVKNSVTPSLDLTSQTAGLWQKNLRQWALYHVTGRPDQAMETNDGGAEGNIQPRYPFMLPLSIPFGSNTDEYKWANYWYQVSNGWMTRANLASLTGIPITWFSHLYDDPANTCPGTYCVDPASSAPLLAVDDTPVSDTDGNVYGAWVSRQSWGSTATQVHGPVVTGGEDHVGADQTPWYHIYKSGRMLLASEAWGVGAIGYPSSIPLTNTPKFGTASPYYFAHPGGSVTVHRSASASGYNYVSVDGGYSLARSLRYVLHDLSGAQDYVIVFDDWALASGTQAITMKLPYVANEAIDGFSRSGDEVAMVRSSVGVRLNSRILFPESDSAISNDASPRCNNPYGSYPCAVNSQSVIIDGGTAQGFEAMVVHQPIASTSGSLPTITGLTSANFLAAQIEDATPRVAAFVRGGTCKDASDTLNTTHSGTGYYRIVGLCPGTYEVLRNGSQIESGLVVSSGAEILAFTASSGAIVAQQTGAVSISAIPSSLSATWTIGDGNPSSQQFTASCVGGSCADIAASESTGWCAVAESPASTFTVSFDPSGSGLTEGTYQCPVSLTAGEAANSPLVVPVTLTVSAASGSDPTITTTTLANGTTGTAYSVALAATGGILPYSWSVPTGTLPAGVTLSTAGVLAGTPTESGTFNFTARVTDSTGTPKTDDQALTLVINAPVVVTIATNPTSLTFSHTLGGAVPASQIVEASCGSDDPCASTASVSSGAWLSVTPSSGSTPRNYTVSVDADGLTPGVYNGAIAVDATEATNGPISVPVSITVATTTLAVVTTGSASAQIGATPTLSISASGGVSPYSFSLDAALPEGLSMSSSGVISGTITSLGQGTYPVNLCVEDSASPIPAQHCVGIVFVAQPNTGLTVTAKAAQDGVVELRSTNWISAGSDCEVVVYQGGNVAYFSRTAGVLGVREIALSGLSVGTATVTAQCGSEGGTSASFTVTAYSGTTAITVQSTIPAGSGATGFTLDYGTTSALGSTATASCSSGVCTASATVASGRVLHWRVRWTGSAPLPPPPDPSVMLVR